MAKERKRDPKKKYFNYKRKRGDRKDGWRVIGADPFFGVIPHIMPVRTASTVHFEEAIDCTGLDEFVRRMRRESDMTDLSRLTVMMAALVRTFSQYPHLNRFVKNRRIWARNYLSVSLVVKREMSLTGEESIIKPKFEPDATLHDVWEKLHADITANKGESENNDTGKLAVLLNAMPVWMLRAVVNIIDRADDKGRFSKLLNSASPFHTSVFITDIGSTGISSVYHHLYDFGTCSQFVSIGKREKRTRVTPEGVEEYPVINFRIVVDERIVDGYYYAKAIRYFVGLMKHPERLLTPPEKVIEDSLR